MYPCITGRLVEARFGVRQPTCLRMLDQPANLGILTEIEPGRRWQRRFLAKGIMAAPDDIIFGARHF